MSGTFDLSNNSNFSSSINLSKKTINDDYSHKTKQK
jgi:hypothetical protein